MKLIACTFLGVLVLLNPVHAASSALKWSTSTPMPEPRSDYAAGVVAGKLIVAGGTFWTGSKGNWIKKQFSASTHAFDPASQTWEKLPDLPVPLACAGSAVVGGRLFVLGGFTGTQVSRKIYVLESRQGGYAWKEFGEFPFDRVYPRAASVGTMLYVVGGTTKFEPRDPTGTCCTSKTATRTLMALDTALPKKGWRELAPFPGPLRFYFNLEADGHAIWMFSGIYQADPKDKIETFPDVSRYDIARGVWAAAKPLPEVSQAGNSPSPVFVGDSIVVINDFKKVWRFDPVKQTYLDLAPLPEAASVDKFVWFNQMIIGASGENFIDPPRRRSEWVFIGKFDPR
jgi:N-acetylneuraminic acid mutarotase